MDALTIILIVLAVLIVAGVVFVMARRKQRSGSVLAAPPTDPKATGRS